MHGRDTLLTVEEVIYNLPMFNFKVIATDKKSRARAGEFTTSHGKVLTPTFVPVGTQATIKSLTPQDLEEMGVQFFFGNTYHLHLRPGEDIVNEFGGLAAFQGWKGPTITDSGGFQVFSLGSKKTRHPERSEGSRGSSAGPQKDKRKMIKILQEEEIESLVKITDDGVEFRSHLDGSKHLFSPEKSIQIQKKLGADIILSFDECPPFPSTYKEAEAANRRTHDWAKRGLKEFRKLSGYSSSAAARSREVSIVGNSPRGRIITDFEQGLVGIIQGSTFQDLREESAKYIAGLDFDAFAIGGVSVGEGKDDMRNAIKWVVPNLPENKLRHLLGIGEVDDIFDAVELGMDTMDCVIPSRLGRTGFVFVNPPEGKRENRFRVDLTKSSYGISKDPIDPLCSCYVCKTFTRGYLHHLFRATELLAYRLATYHNIYFLMELTRKIRESILEGRFQELKKSWLR